MLSYQPAAPRPAGDRGAYIKNFDAEMARLRRAISGWREFPEAIPMIPTADEWAAHVDHVIKTVGADHVGIGLDMAGGRSGVPANASGYGELHAALKRVASPADLRKITGENWMRVLGAAKA